MAAVLDHKHERRSNLAQMNVIPDSVFIPAVV